MALNVNPLVDTTNNTLAINDSVDNRYIGYVIHPNESNAQRDLTDVTLGGISAAAVLVNEPISGNQLSVFYAYFLESEIAARANDNFVPVWAAAPPNTKVYAFQVDGEVDQTNPHNGAAQVVSRPNGPILAENLPSVSVLDGGLAFEFATSGTGGASFTWTNFSQLSINSASGFTTVNAMQAVATAASVTAEYVPSSANRSTLMLLAISEIGNTDPSITDVDSGSGEISPGDTVDIDGTNFEALQGTGIVTISPTDNINDTNAVEVSVYAGWGNTQVSATIPDPLSLLYDPVFIFVTNDTGDSNATGFEVTLTPKAGVGFTKIAFQHDDGILLGVTGVELGVDQIDYSTTSSGGGTVIIGPSGTYEIYDYAGVPPVPDTFTYRLGDKSDQTWSSETTFTVGSVPDNIDATITQTMGAFSQSMSATETSDLDATITQTMGAFSQSMSATETSDLDANITQTMGAFSQNMSATETSDLDANITQTMGAFSQNMSATETSDLDANITQTMGAFSQNMSASSSGGVLATITQTMGAFSQNMSATETSDLDANITQTMGAFSQNMVGSTTGGITATITQTMGAFSQNMSATETSDLDANITQTMGAFSQNMSATETSDLDANITQTMGAFSQNMSATETSDLDANITQTMGAFSQNMSASSRKINRVNITQTMGAFSQNMSATETSDLDANITQTMGAFSQNMSATETSTIEANITQTMGAFSQSLSASETSTIEANITQTMGAFSQNMIAEQVIQQGLVVVCNINTDASVNINTDASTNIKTDTNADKKVSK